MKKNKYAAYVELNKDGAKFYGSDKSSIEGVLWKECLQHLLISTM